MDSIRWFPIVVRSSDRLRPRRQTFRKVVLIWREKKKIFFVPLFYVDFTWLQEDRVWRCRHGLFHRRDDRFRPTCQWLVVEPETRRKINVFCSFSNQPSSSFDSRRHSNPKLIYKLTERVCSAELSTRRILKSNVETNFSLMIDLTFLDKTSSTENFASLENSSTFYPFYLKRCSNKQIDDCDNHHYRMEYLIFLRYSTILRNISELIVPFPYLVCADCFLEDQEEEKEHKEKSFPRKVKVNSKKKNGGEQTVFVSF